MAAKQLRTTYTAEYGISNAFEYNEMFGEKSIFLSFTSAVCKQVFI